jgi:hypothetical protein
MFGRLIGSLSACPCFFVSLVFVCLFVCLLACCVCLCVVFVFSFSFAPFSCIVKHGFPGSQWARLGQRCGFVLLDNICRNKQCKKNASGI